MKGLRLVAAGTALLALTDPVCAHPAPFSYLDLHVQPRGIECTLVAHIFDAAHELNLTPPERLLDPAVVAQQSSSFVTLMRTRLRVLADGRELPAEWGQAELLADRQSIRVQVQFATQSAAESVTLIAALFPYDPMHQTFLNVYEGDSLTQAILDHDRVRFEYFAGSRQRPFAVVKTFLPAGIHHILIGPDHLLFLVGLLLLGGTIRQLTLVVTSFTIAHSMTLTLAALNIVDPPARLIEPAIALSIVYVGADNLLVRGGRDVRAWSAFGFGIIHGFGFARVLREMDLPTRALGWSLFSFNIGVEVGQLLVVVVVASALAALRTRSEAADRQLVFVGSLGVIAAGTFWFVQRAFF